MQKVQIILDPCTIVITKGIVSSSFYLQLTPIEFPCQSWVDLSSSILEMWLYSINKHLLGLEEKTILYFMDGEFSVELERINSRMSLARFVEPNGYIRHSESIDIIYFSRQILSATSKIIAYCSNFPTIRGVNNLFDLSSTLRTTIHGVLSGG